MKIWATTATTALAGLPVAIWFRDCMFSIAHIHGTSMEPCLHDGDVILVRKSDRGEFTEFLCSLLPSGSLSVSASAAAEEKAQLLRSEQNRGLVQYAPVARYYECPPAALTGHVVVYKSPLTALPNELCVKRVVGLGGQYVRRSASAAAGIHTSNSMSQRRHHHPLTRIISVPDYSLYVEGDNKANSVDSRNPVHGAVSKNLLVGVAEYVLWPPSRWQRIQRGEPAKDAKTGKPRAYWF
jgi:signal peptidase I